MKGIPSGMFASYLRKASKYQYRSAVFIRLFAIEIRNVFKESMPARSTRSRTTRQNATVYEYATAERFREQHTKGRSRVHVRRHGFPAESILETFGKYF